MKKAVVFLLIVCVLALNGCGGPLYPALPENAAAFELGEFTYAAEDGAGYGVIVFNGREYLPYGTLRGALHARDVAECVGYVVHEGREDDTDMRFYTLSADAALNYLLLRYEGDAMMEQPSFWRAADTRGEQISVPAFIEPPSEGFWVD